jgi:hypothetical protein
MVEGGPKFSLTESFTSASETVLSISLRLYLAAHSRFESKGMTREAKIFSDKVEEIEGKMKSIGIDPENALKESQLPQDGQ